MKEKIIENIKEALRNGNAKIIVTAMVLLAWGSNGYAQHTSQSYERRY